MKALVVTPYYAPIIGGLENYAQQLNLALASQEHWELVVATSRAGLRREHGTIDGHSIYRLGTWFKISNTPLNPLWPLMLRSIIRRERPDVIIAHTPVPSMADAVALVNGAVPLVLVYHAATLMQSGKPLFNMMVRVYNLFGARTLRRANRIFAVSAFVRDSLPSSLRPKTVVIPNAVWQRDIRVREQPSAAQFVFVASLARTHAWKGLTYVIEAVGRYRETYGDDIQLTVIGDGNMRQEYEHQATHLGVQDHVQFLGALTGEARDNMVNQALAMIVYPATENDAFPTVMLEAWARSVPVIAARIGSLATLVHDGEDGYLCEPRNPEILARKMHEVVMSTSASRAKLAHAAMERTKRDYTWERQAWQVREAIGALL